MIPLASDLLDDEKGYREEIDIFFECNGCQKTTAAAWCKIETFSAERLYRCPRCNWILLEIVPSDSTRGMEYRHNTQIRGFRIIPDAKIYRQPPRKERRAAFLDTNPWDLSGAKRGGPGISLDLQKFELQIREDRRFSALSGLIRSLGSLGSIAEDLRMSQHLCQAAKSIDIMQSLTGPSFSSEFEYLAAAGMINYAICHVLQSNRE